MHAIWQVGRFMQDQRHFAQRHQAGIRVHGHRLRQHALLRDFDHLAVHAHPAAFDGLLGLAARAAQHLCHAFGQALSLAKIVDTGSACLSAVE